MTLTALILVVLMGNDNFIVRERAMGKLFKIRDYAPHVVLNAENSPIPEIAQRAKIVADKWIKEHAEEIVDNELPNNWDNFPWIGHNDEYEDYEFQNYWLDKADKQITNRPPTWERWREASRLWIAELVRNRQSVREVINEMCMMEIRWCLWNEIEPPEKPDWTELIALPKTNK